MRLNETEGFSLESRRPLRAKLIFNPVSGKPGESPVQLAEILTHLQAWEIQPEVYMVQPRSRLEMVARDAIQRGMDMIIVSGGDGTVDNVIGALVGQDVILGILPTGTQNNTARSLGIPVRDLSKAVALLRRGRKLKVDVGLARCRRVGRWFLESATVGLLSALYPAADDIQHGDIGKIGDLLATLISSQPAELTLKLDGSQEEIHTKGHMVMVSNMPTIGAQFQVSPDISYKDNKLDVFVYANLNKIDLLGYAVQASTGIPEDPRIQHFRVKSVAIRTDPKMPVMADGVLLGEGPLNASLRRQAITIMAGPGAQASLIARSELKPEASGHE